VGTTSGVGAPEKGTKNQRRVAQKKKKKRKGTGTTGEKGISCKKRVPPTEGITSVSMASRTKREREEPHKAIGPGRRKKGDGLGIAFEQHWSTRPAEGVGGGK